MNRRSILQFFGLAPLAAAVPAAAEPSRARTGLLIYDGKLPAKLEAGQISLFVYDGTRWVKLDWPQA
jgi:hypothetical protein